MRVARRPLPSVAVEELIATTDVDGLRIHEGETLAFRCRKCGHADETLGQLVHQETCDLAGEHGRELYETLPGTNRGLDSPELCPEHEFLVLVSGASEDPAMSYFSSIRDIREGEVAEAHNSEVVGYRCAECGNSDETVWEIVHDHGCSLEGVNEADASVGRVVTDGGQRD